ncbi:MAG: ABC transporter permease [Paracoccus sp. (in: a-proteobacteria)]|nr:ABC transporter permease [Paracoccus sp. (in: a-proteobacteria)]
MTQTGAAPIRKPLHMEADLALTPEEKRHARREVRRHRLRAFLLVAPLLAFLGFAFLAPIGTMLYRSVYNPGMMQLIPETLDTLAEWDGVDLPPEEARADFAVELRRLFNERRSGRLGEEINRVMPGASSTIQSTGRALSREDEADVAARGAEMLAEANANWRDGRIWRSMQQAGQVYTDRNFLTALDLERGPDGEIRARESARIYINLYVKTLRIALIITLATMLLGYPLAFYLSRLSPGRANLLMIFVLLPFWTSLLVRTTAWIALLQTNGVVNSTLIRLGVIRQPMTLLYTEFSTILAMTHILLPFMVLPLYAVMRGIDPSYMRAAMSMGAKPLAAWWAVYLPASLPGLSAGAMLVFIISVGYYITPALVGGTDGQMISNLIAFHMTESNNWGLAAALGSLLLGLILVIYFLFDRLVGASNIKLG